MSTTKSSYALSVISKSFGYNNSIITIGESDQHELNNINLMSDNTQGFWAVILNKTQPANTPFLSATNYSSLEALIDGVNHVINAHPGNCILIVNFVNVYWSNLDCSTQQAHAFVRLGAGNGFLQALQLLTATGSAGNLNLGYCMVSSPEAGANTIGFEDYCVFAGSYTNNSNESVATLALQLVPVMLGSKGSYAVEGRT